MARAQNTVTINKDYGVFEVLGQLRRLSNKCICELSDMVRITMGCGGY